MKASKLALCLLVCLSTATSNAENRDSIKIVKLEQTLQKEVKARKALASKCENQQTLILNQGKLIDSLRMTVNQNSQNIKATANQLGVKIDETNTTLNSKADSSDVEIKALWGGILFVILTLLGGITYFILHKRINKGNADVDALKEKAEKLNEDILNQFSLEMSEMQKISKSLDALYKTTSCDENTAPDHSLIKTLADRITFMEMTLSKMDSNVKGFKQLNKSISQMKDNLLANGYELVEMLGKPYNNGMKVIANFIEDEELELGKQIITGIIKPQINYNGIMIQAAQITVSQNI